MIQHSSNYSGLLCFTPSSVAIVASMATTSSIDVKSVNVPTFNGKRDAFQVWWLLKYKNYTYETYKLKRRKSRIGRVTGFYQDQSEIAHQQAHSLCDWQQPNNNTASVTQNNRPRQIGPVDCSSTKLATEQTINPIRIGFRLHSAPHIYKTVDCDGIAVHRSVTADRHCDFIS